MKEIIDLNVQLNEWPSSKLGINTKLVFSSQLDIQGSKTELLLDICNKFNSDQYLSPAGSKEYIDENKKAGDVLTKKNLRIVRPGLGLSPKYFKVILGRIVCCDVKKGTAVNWDLLK